MTAAGAVGTSCAAVVGFSAVLEGAAVVTGAVPVTGSEAASVPAAVLAEAAGVLSLPPLSPHDAQQVRRAVAARSPVNFLIIMINTP